MKQLLKQTYEIFRDSVPFGLIDFNEAGRKYRDELFMSWDWERELKTRNLLKEQLLQNFQFQRKNEILNSVGHFSFLPYAYLSLRSQRPISN